MQLQRCSSQVLQVRHASKLLYPAFTWRTVGGEVSDMAEHGGKALMGTVLTGVWALTAVPGRLRVTFSGRSMVHTVECTLVDINVLIDCSGKHLI